MRDKPIGSGEVAVFILYSLALQLMLDRVESAQTAGGLLGVTYVHHIAFTHVLQVDGVAKCLKRLNAVAKLFCLNAGAQVERIQAACGKRQCLSLQLGIDGISLSIVHVGKVHRAINDHILPHVKRGKHAHIASVRRY